MTRPRTLVLITAASLGAAVGLAAAAVIGFVAYDGWVAEREGRP